MLMKNAIKSIISLNGMCQSAIKWRLTDICNYKCSYCIREKLTTKKVLPYKENEELILNASKEVTRIIKELPGYVKLDLIGGEVSIFNLHDLLDNMYKECGDKLKRVNITTNMSAPSDYYNDLVNLCDSYGSEIGITCSWHSEFISMKEFINKFKKIKSPNQKGIRIECVSRTDNKKDIEKLISICEKNNYAYFIEKDLMASEFDKNFLISKSSSNKKDRYRVDYENNKTFFYKTRNGFLTNYDEGDKSFFESMNYMCSRDYDYVYIEIDEHIGRLSEKSNCRSRNKLSDFHPLKRPAKCLNDFCTLCGQISISKESDDLLK